jgi:hypothetical protein
MGLGLRWLIYGWVVFTVGACPPRAAVAGGVRPFLSAGSFVFGFLLCVVYPLVFSCTVCLYTAKILLEFVLAKC